MREFIAAVAGVVLVYMMFAFVKAEIDFTAWGEAARFGCVMLAGLMGYVCAGVAFFVWRR